MVPGAVQIAKSRLLETGSDRNERFDKFERAGDIKRNRPCGQLALRETNKKSRQAMGWVRCSLLKFCGSYIPSLRAIDPRSVSALRRRRSRCATSRRGLFFFRAVRMGLGRCKQPRCGTMIHMIYNGSTRTAVALGTSPPDQKRRGRPMFVPGWRYSGPKVGTYGVSRIHFATDGTRS
jgi:hypothetical protein